MNSTLSKYIDVDFFKKFLIFLVLIHSFNTFNLAITVPGGSVYSSFLDNNLNYIAWIRSFILYMANVITHILGTNSFVDLPETLRAVHGSYVIMGSACIGLGLMSFWLAFVIANPGSLRKKIFWCITGILSILFINSVRAALLLIAINNHWKVNRFMNHHTMFNIVAYMLIGLLIYFFMTKNKKEAEELELAM